MFSLHPRCGCRGILRGFWAKCARWILIGVSDARGRFQNWPLLVIMACALGLLGILVSIRQRVLNMVLEVQALSGRAQSSVCRKPGAKPSSAAAAAARLWQAKMRCTHGAG